MAHVAAAVLPNINPVLSKDKSNANQFFCADVVGHKRFAQNFGGYPRSEIAEINAQTDLAVQSSLLAQLTDYSTGDNPNAGLTDAEIMLSHKSKYCQTSNEVISWLEGRIAERDARIAAAELKESKEAPIDNELDKV